MLPATWDRFDGFGGNPGARSAWNPSFQRSTQPRRLPVDPIVFEKANRAQRGTADAGQIHLARDDLSLTATWDFRRI